MKKTPKGNTAAGKPSKFKARPPASIVPNKGTTITEVVEYIIEEPSDPDNTDVPSVGLIYQPNYNMGYTLKNTMVHDQGWFGVARNDTVERMCPQLVGEPEWQKSVPGTNSASAKYREVSLTEDAPYSGFCEKLRFYVTSGQVYDVLLGIEAVNNTGALWRSRHLGAFTATSTGWHEFNIPGQILPIGKEIHIRLRSLSQTVASTVNSVWRRATYWGNTTPEPTSGAIHWNRANNVLLVSYFDNSTTDHTAFLQSMTVGDRVGDWGVIYSKFNFGDYVRFDIDPNYLVYDPFGDVGYPLFNFEFNKITATSLTMPDEGGDYQVQRAIWSGDWDLLGRIGTIN